MFNDHKLLTLSLYLCSLPNFKNTFRELSPPHFINVITMKTIKTTTSFYDYEPPFYEFHEEMFKYKVEESSFAATYISYFGLLLCYFHCFILTRNEMKSNFVFRCVLVICISDIVIFLKSIPWNLVEWNSNKLEDNECPVTIDYFQEIVFIFLSASMPIVKHISSIFVLILSGTHIFSISNRVKQYQTLLLSVILVTCFALQFTPWRYSNQREK